VSVVLNDQDGKPLAIATPNRTFVVADGWQLVVQKASKAIAQSGDEGPPLSVDFVLMRN
jgi:hypothetical protein